MSNSSQPSVDQLAQDVEELDLFGEVTEEEQQALDEQKQLRFVQSSERKKDGKQKPAAKTIITIQIVPGVPEDDDDEDYEYDEEEEDDDELTPKDIMSNLITYVRGLELEGLTWSEGHEVTPIYGLLEMLTINALIVDDLVPSVDDVTELIINSANRTVRSATVVSLQKA